MRNQTITRRFYTFKDTVDPRSDFSIKDIGFLPSRMVVITQKPKHSKQIIKKGQWSAKEVGIFNPNKVPIEAEIKFFGIERKYFK